MKKCAWVIAACLAFSAFCALFTGISGVISEYVSVPVSRGIARITSISPFPVTGIFIMLVIAAACLVKPRFFAVITSLIVVYSILWTPTYFAVSPRIPRADEAGYRALCDYLVEELNAMGRVDCDPVDAIYQARLAMGVEVGVRGARYPEILRAFSLAGIYVPFTGEALVDTTRPPAGIAFTAAHELAHLLGAGDEALANIRAYEACVSYGGAAGYSARLWALSYASWAVDDREKALAQLDSEIRRDLGGIPYSRAVGGDYAQLADYLCSVLIDN